MTAAAERPVISEPNAKRTPLVDLMSYKEFAGRMRFTRDTCDFLERVGILSERYELLDGEIILKLGQNRPHVMALSRLVGWLVSVYGATQVQNQAPVEVANADRASNRPEPDVAVLARPDSEVANTPKGADLHLVVEVSDTTLRDDLVIKAALYARAGIEEYWVIDLNGRRVYVHRSPTEGAYIDVTVVGDVEMISSISAPGSSVQVLELLPPREPLD